MYSLSFVGIREFNKLNVPTHDRRHQVKAKEVICQAAEFVHELVSGMSNFHTYTEQVSNDILVSNEVLFFCLFYCEFLISWKRNDFQQSLSNHGLHHMSERHS